MFDIRKVALILGSYILGEIAVCHISEMMRHIADHFRQPLNRRIQGLSQAMCFVLIAETGNRRSEIAVGKLFKACDACPYRIGYGLCQTHRDNKRNNNNRRYHTERYDYAYIQRGLEFVLADLDAYAPALLSADRREADKLIVTEEII